MADQDYPLVADEQADSDGNPVFWSNPDVPDISGVLGGSVEHFDCPYPGCMNDFEFSMSVSDEEARDALADLVDQHDGTLRCEDCNEPIYGFRGNGDHEDDD